jgi:hypothetical protein
VFAVIITPAPFSVTNLITSSTTVERVTLFR